MTSGAVRRHILLRLDAPLMAFGAPIVDQHGVTGDVPLPSTIAGLLANALGYRRTDFAIRNQSDTTFRMRGSQFLQL